MIFRCARRSLVRSCALLGRYARSNRALLRRNSSMIVLQCRPISRAIVAFDGAGACFRSVANVYLPSGVIW